MAGKLIRALRPEVLVPVPGLALAGGGLVVRGEGAEARVRAVLVPGEEPPVPWRDYPGEVWLPRPILLHAHLEDHDAPTEDLHAAADGFADWIRALLAWRAGQEADPDVSTTAVLDELEHGGVGLVVAHAEAGGVRAAAGRRGVLPLLEVLAPGEGAGTAASATSAAAAIRRSAAELGAGGVAVHAPYTVGTELARALFRGGALCSVHLGESAEERRFLAAGDGPLADLLRERGAPPPTERFPSPVAWLEACGGARPGVLAVHGGDLTAEELGRLERAGVGVVFCPGTHHAFGRSRPAFAAAGERPPLLGCDSRASNPRLHPLRELRLAHETVPEFGPVAWWASLTTRAAAWLEDPLRGRIRAGGPLDPLRVRLPVPASHDRPEALAADLLGALAELGEAAELVAGTP